MQPRRLHNLRTQTQLRNEDNYTWYYMRTRVCEFEMHLRLNVLLLYLNAWYQVYSTGYMYVGGFWPWRLTPTTRTEP